jgi:UDP-glucose 4-epimerase
MGVDPRIEHLPPRNEVKDAYSSHDKVRRIFGEQKNTDLLAGLSRMAGWARRHGARSSGAFKEVEIQKNMPECWREATIGASSR